MREVQVHELKQLAHTGFQRAPDAPGLVNLLPSTLSFCLVHDHVRNCFQVLYIGFFFFKGW